MHLSQFLGNNYYNYLSMININTNEDYPIFINLLLENTISNQYKFDLIKIINKKDIEESILFANKNYLLDSIFQTILINQGAWSKNFTNNDDNGEEKFKREQKYLDELFLFFLDKEPTNLIDKKFLVESNILSALIVYELPLSLDRALNIISNEDKVNFFSKTKLNFTLRYSSNEDYPSLYYNIFQESNLEMIDVLIKHGFDLNMIDHNQQNIGWYIKDVSLLNYLISKGFNFNLNHFDGNQTLKNFIKENKNQRFNREFISFFNEKADLLPINIDEILQDLKADFSYEKKNKFKKNLSLFYTNAGYFLYDQISIRDIILFHLFKDMFIHNREKYCEFYDFIKKFLTNINNDRVENADILDKIVSKDITNISLQNIKDLICKIQYLISIKDKSLYPCIFLENIGTFILKIIKDSSFINELDKNELFVLSEILFLSNNSFFPVSLYHDDHNIREIIIQKLNNENINPTLTKIITDIFIRNKKFEDIKEILLDLEPKYIDFIKKDMTLITDLFDKQKNYLELNSLYEKYEFNKIKSNNISYDKKRI